MSEVVSRVLYSLDPALKQAGSSLDELLLEHALSPRAIRAFPGSRIPWNTFAEILEDAGERLGGQRALEDVGANSLIWNWPILVALASRYVTPAKAFQLGVKWFCPVIFRGVRGYLEEIPGGLVETVVIPPDRRDSREFFSLCLGVMRQFPAVIGWETTELEFAHFDHRGVYRMQFERSRTRKRVPPAAHRGADPNRDLEELSILRLDSEFPSVPDPPSSLVGGPVAERTRSLLRQDEFGMALTAAEAAHRLATSDRSLARRLALERTSFRALRDEVRREIAMERIQGGAPISEIAHRLGFADAPSFHRAFRRWTGRSPGRYRQEVESALSLSLSLSWREKTRLWLGKSIRAEPPASILQARRSRSEG